MHSWRCGSGNEGGKEEGKVQSQGVLHVDCASGYVHQQITYNICGIHIHGRVTPRVVTWLGKPGQGVLNCKSLDTE